MSTCTVQKEYDTLVMAPDALVITKQINLSRVHKSRTTYCKMVSNGSLTLKTIHSISDTFSSIGKSFTKFIRYSERKRTRVKPKHLHKTGQENRKHQNNTRPVVAWPGSYVFSLEMSHSHKVESGHDLWMNKSDIYCIDSSLCVEN